MIAAFVRLALIAVGAVSLIIFGVFIARTLGSFQGYQAPPHPWFERSAWNFEAPEIAAICASTRLAPSQPGWILVVPIKYIEGEWRLPCPQNPPVLREVLARADGTDWLLQVDAHETTHLDKLVDNVSPFDKRARFAIYAPAQMVARDLRKRAPQWLFAADSASLLRLQLFRALWLETATEFWPDFVITSNDRANPAHLQPRVAQELLRRKKRVIWDARVGAPKPEFEVQGVMTARPEDNGLAK